VTAQGVLAPAIVVQGLRVQRSNVAVLHDLSFEVPAGQVVGLLGPSGGGKTTLMRAIVGVQVVEGGTVTVLGQPAGSVDLRHRIGYVTQNPAVYRDLTLFENLQYFAAVLGVDGANVDKVIADVDLREFRDRTVAAMSGGQQARVSLAVALLGTPELLVLDEPTVGLDPLLRRDLWDLFHRLAAAGKTLLVSSHVMDEATRCQRLLLLREGRLIADETPQDLLARTHTTDIESAFLRLVQGQA
jgi:ABC-2 type transport system ATP-binding protein